MQASGSGGGYADGLGSRIVVFGGLVLVAMFVLGAAVALGLKDGGAKRSAATTTQTQTVPRPPPPPVIEPEATEPEAPEVETTPEIEPPPPPPTAADNCDDGIDNDGDDLLDALQDDGCLADNTEAPANRPGDGSTPEDLSECNDGIDNDGDGFADDEDLECPGETETRTRRSPPTTTVPPG